MNVRCALKAVLYVALDRPAAEGRFLPDSSDSACQVKSGLIHTVWPLHSTDTHRVTTPWGPAQIKVQYQPIVAIEILWYLLP